MCKISKELLNILTYEFSNVRENGVVKQFIFTDDTTIEEARDFMKHYYPDIDFDLLIKK